MDYVHNVIYGMFKCFKVIFLHLFVILFTGEGVHGC